ncbi:uncharacterized protein BJX67DRAFT_355988 [Aspergillus lucknowensis]|uniref:DUF1989 domain-containing protein n=1 Tax=Aspergillus lucknowensis TaxID=176173 RepID=A0ABR4LQ11_9EURO
MPTIPARRFAVQRLHIGQSIKVIDSTGGQVIDTWAFSIPSTPSFPRYMSMTHTRSTLHKLLPSIHESFLDNKRDPILTITEDTSPGIHDVLYAACSPERYLQLGADKDHDNCAGNLHSAVQQCTEPFFSHILHFLESGWIPDPLNLFMKVDIDGTNLQVLNPDSKAGDYIVLKAEQECVVIMSACPMDLTACNRGEPSSAEFEVL